MDNETPFLLTTRPSWDEYFMTEACWVSSRSHDPRTRHGCVIVNDNKKPIGQGYNGFPHGGKVAYPTDPDNKYAFIIHSECNSILNCTFPPEGCTLYVTGMPCNRCMLQIVQAKIKKVIYGKVSSVMVDEKETKNTMMIAENHGIEMEEYKGKISPRQWLLHMAEYLKSKGWE